MASASAMLVSEKRKLPALIGRSWPYKSSPNARLSVSSCRLSAESTAGFRLLALLDRRAAGGALGTSDTAASVPVPGEDPLEQDTSNHAADSAKLLLTMRLISRSYAWQRSMSRCDLRRTRGPDHSETSPWRWGISMR